VILAQILPDRIGNHWIRAGNVPARLVQIDHPHLRQLPGILHRQRLQQHRIEKLEYGRIGANAQSKRGDHDKCEARALGEDAQGTPHIVPEALEPECNIFR
jgi:hypothetical protein